MEISEFQYYNTDIEIQDQSKEKEGSQAKRLINLPKLISRMIYNVNALCSLTISYSPGSGPVVGISEEKHATVQQKEE